MNNALKKTTIGDTDADLAPRVFGFAALGVMAAMFALMGFSMTIIIFLVLVGYFVWRAVAKTEMHEIRGIFEFYLAANEVLRDDERRWYGFEIQDVIMRGQRILSMMPDPPPLVHFTMGALHHRVGNFQQAENHFAFLLEDTKADEINRMAASSELKSYVRILRKLEREPAEAPLTTAAIRALERARRHRAGALLSESRYKSQELTEAAVKAKAAAELPKSSEPIRPLLERLSDSPPIQNQAEANGSESAALNENREGDNQQSATSPGKPSSNNIKQSFEAKIPTTRKSGKLASSDENGHRSSISEVLHDIYD